MGSTSRGKRVLAAILVLLGLPVVLASAEAVSFLVRNRSNGSLISSGQRREYILHVPPGYDGGRPVPLVISLHGASGWPAQQRDVSRWNRVADQHGFLVVYPAATRGAGPRVWHVGRTAGLARDVRFISDLVDELQARYNIDSARIYANGMSNGGAMTFALSCTLSSRIAAFGMVGAAQTLPFSWCTDRKPVPVIVFHGTADRLVPYRGGMSWMASAPFPDTVRWAASWARRNRCGESPAESVVAADVKRTEYTGCGSGAAVVLYTIEGGGHTWPGGEPLPRWWLGKTTTSIDASALMWQFFREHPLREARTAASRE